MKVLIVDDKPENLYLLELILKGSGYITVSAKNGEEALSLARKDIPDLIISDILMPVMDGFTLCRELKKDEKLRCIPFIFYTATYTDVKDEEFALSLGADKFILKPQDPEEFIANIKTVLKEAGEKNIQRGKAPSTPEAVILKEYNEALVRKLEDKMLQAEQSEKEIRKYNILLLKEIEERKHKEVLLRESERQISLIYDTVGDVIFNLKVEGDGSYIFTSVNQCFFKTTGLQANQIIGKRVHEIIPEPSLTLVLEKYAEAIRVRKILRWEETSLYPTGELIGEVSIAPVFDDALNCISLVGSVHDITERKRTEEALIASEHLFQTLAIVSPVGIFRTHHDGYTTYVNPKWCQISGLPSDDALGFGWLKAVHPDDREKLSNEWQESTKDQKASYSEYRFLHADGTITWVMGQAIPEMDSENKIVGYIGTITDITERKHAEEEITMLAQSLRSINECVSITDMEDKILFVNESFLKTYGYNEDELIGRNVSMLRSSNNSSELVKEILPNTISGGWQGELWNKRKDGTEFPVYLSTTIINDKEGKLLGLIGVAIDITERKRAEKELIDAKEKAELSDKLKSEFLAQMSHEIRTPLNAIVGNVDYLKDAFSEKVDLDTRESFDSIDLSSKRIIRTVDLILNVAEFQTSGYEPRLVKVDLNSEVLKKLYEEHLLLAQKKGLDLIYKCEVKEVKVLADEYSITQTFANLIDNAIKYTKKGKVEILLKKNKDNNIIVEIKDTGIGISKEFRKQLFKPFVQEEQGYTRSYDGSGLGLTLVKNYCDINRVVIEVESEKNVGSTFRIIFNK